MIGDRDVYGFVECAEWRERELNNGEVIEREISLDNQPVSEVTGVMLRACEGLVDPTVDVSIDDVHGYAYKYLSIIGKKAT